MVVTQDAINANSPVAVVVLFTDAVNPKRTYPSHVWLAKGSAALHLGNIAKEQSGYGQLKYPVL